MPRQQTIEDQRLEEARARKKHWKRWGPYLSERQWGTVREDYSPGGTAWEFFPHDHARLVEENRRRGREAPEFELLDTGVFAENRYFDIYVEYAKADVEDILIKITAANRGPEAAALHLLPSLWFRNTWSWGRDLRRPSARAATCVPGSVCAELQHWQYGKRWLLCAGQPELLFTENETNHQRLSGGKNRSYVKDAFHAYVIQGDKAAVNPQQMGTKM